MLAGKFHELMLLYRYSSERNIFILHLILPEAHHLLITRTTVWDFSTRNDEREER
jgi:hypothetical protein